MATAVDKKILSVFSKPVLRYEGAMRAARTTLCDRAVGPAAVRVAEYSAGAEVGQTPHPLGVPVRGRGQLSPLRPDAGRRYR